jgi:hypothetical protein
VAAKNKSDREQPLTGTTPKLADIKVGTVLHGKFKGKQHQGTVVEQDGIHMLRVGKAVFKSLSSAGQSITQKACRGGVFWNLLPRPDYRAAGATPAPPKPKSAKKPKTAPAKDVLDQVLLPTFQQMRGRKSAAKKTSKSKRTKRTSRRSK